MTTHRPEARRGVVEVEPAAYTIPEFTVAHRMSESFYYKIRRLGLGPDESRTLDHIVITAEAAARWRAKREADTKLMQAESADTDA
jgi:hypothetical protein